MATGKDTSSKDCGQQRLSCKVTMSEIRMDQTILNMKTGPHSKTTCARDRQSSWVLSHPFALVLFMAIGDCINGSF